MQPKGKRRLADEAVALIGKLYGIERDHKDGTDAQRLLARQQHSVPALAILHSWMEKNLPLVTPKSALGTALAYMQTYWHGLSRYIERGDLPIDNNDHPLTRDVLLRTCAGFGWQATALGSGAAALEELRHSAIESRDYDLKLLDLHMPGMDGIETLRQAYGAPDIGLPQVILMGPHLRRWPGLRSLRGSLLRRQRGQTVDAGGFVRSRDAGTGK